MFNSFTKKQTFLIAVTKYRTAYQRCEYREEGDYTPAEVTAEESDRNRQRLDDLIAEKFTYNPQLFYYIFLANISLLFLSIFLSGYLSIQL
ncbi:hypothetical protein ACKC9G_07830 [Pokkaliibacter sp. CJK22405]|uniref:hypothetical protein n=1 Tax=Pokkaliibacter sp. CJK22405 TaxID=3384615 RepID=UPI00398491D0